VSERNWELHGRITRVNKGVQAKSGRPFQMIQVGGFTFFLEPELFDGYVEGEQVVVRGLFVRDVRNASGAFEPVHVLEGIERQDRPLPRLEKGKPD